MTSQVTKEEAYRLARTMTWKNALAGILGGAKAGIIWKGGRPSQKTIRPKFCQSDKAFSYEEIHRWPGCVNTEKKEMQWFAEAAGNLRAATGKAFQTVPPVRRKMRSASRAGQYRLSAWPKLRHRHQDEGFGHKANDSGDRKALAMLENSL